MNHLVNDAGLLVQAAPMPFTTRRVEFYAPPGSTIDQIVAQAVIDAGLDPDIMSWASVFVGDQMVPRDRWRHVRPKPGHIISLRVLPAGGGGGKNPLRAVLSLALMAATPYLSGIVGAQILGAGIYGPLTAGQALLSRVIVGAAGSLLINAIAPPSTPKLNTRRTGDDSRDSQTLFIQGARNRLNPYGVAPEVLGTHRHFPPQAAQPYTESVDNDQYVRQVFDWGYAPLALSEVRIGDTLLSEFEGVEFRTYVTGTGTPELFPGTVSQVEYNVLIDQASGWVTRTTGADIKEIEVDITFPQGLVEFDENTGSKLERTVTIEIQYAPTGTSTWSVGSSFEAVGGQTSATFPDPPGVQNGYDRERYDAVVLDKASGAVSVIEGRANAIHPTGRELAAAELPEIPETKILLARVTRTTGDTDIVAGNITDLRDPDLVGDVFQSAGDFLVSASASVNKVDVAAGNLLYAGINITATQSSALRISRRFQVAAGQYDVRVRRTTADSSDTRIFDQVYLTSIKGFEHEAPVNEAGRVVSELRIKATGQLNGPVDRLNAIASKEAKDYDSVGGTWPVRAFTNPASAYRYVLEGGANANALAEAEIDVTRLEEWHDFCVTNGYSFNAVIDFDISVDELLGDIAAAGRARPHKRDNLYSVVIDEEKTVPVQHFSPKNSWGYRGEIVFPDVPHAFRAQFVNENAGYEQDERIVYADGYDAGSATLFETLEHFGVTDPDAIYKLTREHLAVVQLRREQHSFYVDIENLVAEKGDLIRFSHDVPLIGLASGRVKSVTDDGGGPANATHVTLDEICTMEAGKSYSIRFRLDDGSTLVKSVVTAAGDQTTLEFTTPFALTSAPAAGDLFQFGETGSESADLVILDIIPQEGEVARITAVNHAQPEIANSWSGTIPDFETYITTPPELARPSAPVIVSVQTGEEAMVRNIDGSISSRMVITLQNNNQADVRPVVWIREGAETDYHLAHVASATATRVEIEGCQSGRIYDVQIAYARTEIAGSNMYSAKTTQAGIVFAGAGALPPDVTGFRHNILGNTATLVWDRVTVLDLDHYEIRFAPVLSGATWASSAPLLDDVPRLMTTASVPSAIGTYLIKAVDIEGNKSENATSIVTNIAGLANLNAVETATEDPSFAGTHDKTVVSGSALQLGAADAVDDWPDVDAVLNWDLGNAGLETEGTYTFANAVDLGAVYTSTLTADFTVTGANLSNLMDGWSNIDDVDNWDGVDPGTYSVELQVRKTDDDPAGSPTWTAWERFVVGDYTARAFQFRIILRSQASAVTPSVTALSVSVDMPDRYIPGEDITSNAAGSAITFTDPFKAIKAVAVTGQDMATGDYYEITAKSASGFTIRFFNSTGTGISRTFDYVAVGYGVQN